jgi:membrane-anchored mycosin MYCP
VPRRMKHALAVAVLVTLPLLGAAPTAIAAPPPRGACHSADPARPQVREQPWAQQVLDPRRAWDHTRGGGVLVAVIDSGVDSDHPQLRRPGKVLPGRDFFLSGSYPGNFDCVSHGTGVASIIAADPLPGVGFAGVAPDARILPVRISDRDVGDRGESIRIDPRALAGGIRYAVDSGARVVNLSLAGFDDFPVVRDAVAYAVARDVLVVAAAGNSQQNSAALPSFPAGYDGVLGVGAVQIDGARLSGSQVGPYVDIAAPGGEVLAATRADGHAYLSGTSYAAPFVAGVAALVRARFPHLSAAQVAQRLLATSSPARGGLDSTGYGAGLVNPYRAVTDRMDSLPPEALPRFVPVPPDQAELARVAVREETAATAKWLAAVLGGALVVAVIGTAIRARGTRRRWRPGFATTLPDAPEPVEPPEQIFLLGKQK